MYRKCGFVLLALLLSWLVLPVQADYFGLSDWDIQMIGPDGTLGTPTELNLSGNPPYLLHAFTFLDYTIPHEDLVLGTSETAVLGGSVQESIDDFDLNTIAAKSGNPPDIKITMLGGNETWQNTNGDQYDFFVFEAGRNDQMTVQPILTAEGDLGEAVVLEKSNWLPSVPEDGDINLRMVGTNNNQVIGGIAWKVTDMLDANGDPLTNESVIYGVMLRSGGVDIGCFCAVKGVLEAPPIATEPSPADQALVVPVDAQLAWREGKTVAEQTLYLSTHKEDVENGVGGVTVTGESYDPGTLLSGMTYYWRIDTSDGTDVHEGTLWSFATVSGAGDGLQGDYFTGEDYLAGDPVVVQVDPQIDFSWNVDDPAPPAGINRDQFSVRWRGEITVPADGAYTFILNSDDGSRLFINGDLIVSDWSNHGRRDAEGAVDLVAGRYPIRVEFYQGGGDNAGISLSWESDRITRQIVPTGVLSAVVGAEVIDPALNAENVSQAASLQWLPINSSVKSDVYLGTDAEAVEAADTTTEGIYIDRVDGDTLTPADELALGTTYFWRIDQVDGATVTKGHVWSFTVAPAWVVDDFESYTPDFDAGEAIYQTWIDGYGNESENGAIVGNGDNPEYTLVNNGKQSMPLHYVNDVAKLSEATRTFDPAQNWQTVQGKTVSDLELYIRGNTPPGDFSYDEERERYTIGAMGTGLEGDSDGFRFTYKKLTGNGSITARLLSITRLANETPAGLQIRETLDPDSKFAQASLRAGAQAYTKYRDLKAGQVVQGEFAPAWPGTLVIPQWLRLTRRGNQFTAEYSVDGASWVAMGDPMTVEMGQAVYVGLAVAARQPDDDRQVNTTTWEGVSVDGNVDQAGPFDTFADIGIPMNAEEEMYVVIEDAAGATTVAVNGEGSSVTLTQDWTQWTIEASALSGVNLSQVKSMTIGLGKKAAPVNNGTGTMFIDDIRLIVAE